MLAMATHRDTARPLLEICAGSVSDAIAAFAGGADRIELCSATEIGGLTPSAAQFEATLEAVRIPVIALIRPRAGGFCYSNEEFKTALRDAELAIALGAAGVAFGFLRPDSCVDTARCREAIAIAGDCEKVFHRAFDFVADPHEAVEELIALGVTRVLTSGREATALAGASLIRSLVEHSGGRLEIMPGGGITPENVLAVWRQTGCNQIHAGASRPATDSTIDAAHPIQFFSTTYLAGGCHRSVDGSLVRDLVSRLEANNRR